MKDIGLYRKASNKLNNLNDLSLLFLRLVLAFGFYKPATMKWGKKDEDG